MFLNKTPPSWWKHLEILKLIPKDWQDKLKQNTFFPEQDTIKVMVLSSKRKWQKKNIAETQCKDFYHTLHQRKIIPQCQWNKCKDWQ